MVQKNDQLAREWAAAAAGFPNLRPALTALRRGGKADIASSLLTDPVQIRELGAARDRFPAFGQWIGSFVPSSLPASADQPAEDPLVADAKPARRRLILASPGTVYEDLQRAVDDLCPGGGMVLLAPHWTYEIADPPLRIAAPNLTIRGSGESIVCLRPKLTEQVPPGSPRAVIEITSPETKPGQETIVLDGFRVEGPHPRWPEFVARGHGVHIRGARQDITLRNLTILSFAEGDGVRIEDATGNVALHSLFVWRNGTGLRIVNSSEAVDRGGTGTTSVSGSMIFSSLGFNIAMRRARRVRIAASALDSANLSSVAMTSSSDVVLAGCRFEANCQYSNVDPRSQEFLLGLSPEMWRAQLDIGSPWPGWPADHREKRCQGVCIQGCYFKSGGYSRNGVFIRDGSDVNAIGNTFSDYTSGHMARDPSRSPEVCQVGNYDRAGNPVTVT